MYIMNKYVVSILCKHPRPLEFGLYHHSWVLGHFGNLRLVGGAFIKSR